MGSQQSIHLAFIFTYRHLMRRGVMVVAMGLTLGGAAASSTGCDCPVSQDYNDAPVGRCDHPDINKCRDMPLACIPSNHTGYHTDTCRRHVPTSAADQPAKGDLVFVAGGDSDFSQAITSATALTDFMAFDHVGIIDVDSAGVWVVEASPRDGVTVTPWSDFKGSSPRLMIVCVNSSIDTDAAVERAKECVGRPYDWAYGCGTDSIYCSELVQIAYLDADGKPIFESRPMNFRDASGDIPEFWVRLFDNLGVPIPQGVPGTNPNDMARDALCLSGRPPQFIDN